MEITGRRKVKNPKVALRNALNGPPAKKYWQLKMPHLSPTLNKVDSKAMEQAISELPTHKRRWVTKQITGQFAHGKNMQWRGQWATAKCP